MITAGLVGLRAREASDVAVLHTELYDDIATQSRSDSRPWRPTDPSSDVSPYAVYAPSDDRALFSVVELSTAELAGEAVLWAIDVHNRSAHLGMSLRPSSRGRGLGTDVVRALCRYGFDVRGLHRLQVETLADNHPMIRAAERVGFIRDGTLRQAQWVLGSFLDEVVLGLIDADYRSTR